MVWPDDKESMTLNGVVKDREHVKRFFEKFTPEIRVEGIDNTLTTRQNIKDSVDQVVRGRPPLMVAYFQGHSQGGSGPLRYVTGDRNEDGSLEGFTAEKLIKMFSKLSQCTMSMVITDVCNFGNLYRLQFQLILDGDRYLWWETNEWSEDNKLGRKYRITSPMLHVAASLEWQSAYETDKRGGYLTNSLGAAEPRTLPQLLLHLRQGVDGHMKDAKIHPRSPLAQELTQFPQIFSTYKLPLDDPEIFSKIYLGTAKP
ncbi:unnamed protein product [Rhizoctonia solani]|uniref:Peptidase C14 caspase domain-containing protein n=1 Tax=Rhizoctonia solani TaxID=456999 RepID=A0A8H3H925_9AGAM|nr:unnamed protein product [Rhizoctonia solani]